MKDMRTELFGIIMLGAVLALSGCTVYPAHEHYQQHGYGPPPHAPAHGYRHKYHDHELVYDSYLGVYVVVNLHDHYFIDDVYYRWTGDGWYASHYLDKGWYVYEEDRLPPGLYKKYKNNKHKHYDS